MGNMKKALVTRAKNIGDITAVSHPILKQYAKTCGADFLIINEDKINIGSFHYEILQCYELFETYDRILVIDSDVLITPSCPDLFDVVPYDCIGTIYEDKFARAKTRKYLIKKVQEEWGSVGWESGYINTGVFLASKVHRDIFKHQKDKVWLRKDEGFDDIYLGYKIHEHKFKVFELPYKFNHMSMFSELGRNWLKSYIIHYAGRGFTGKKSRAEQMQLDLQILQQVFHPFLLNFYYIPQRLRLLAIGILNFSRGN